MAIPLVIVVTGTNRGVGKAIVELLAKQDLHRPLTIYATSRSGHGSDMMAQGANKILFHQLDIAKTSSISAFFTDALSEVSAIDVLINNAAVSHDHCEDAYLAAETIWNNYGGTRDMCKAFLSQPHLKADARIVNITSGLNGLATYGYQVQTGFQSANNIDDLDAMAQAYLDAMERGQVEQQETGWGSGKCSYKVSKALINMLTILLGRQNPGVIINSCCPGWIDTDMGRTANGKPPKAPKDGAKIPIRLAIGDVGEEGDSDGALGSSTSSRSGYFFENDRIVDCGWGKAKLWLET